LETKFLDKNTTLPYIPKRKIADLDRLKEGENIAKKFIKILQEHPDHKIGTRLTMDKIYKAVDIGIELSENISK